MHETIFLIQACAVIFVSGMLYVFSDFVMRAFDKLPPRQAIQAMRSINSTVYTSLFMILFVGLVISLLISSVWAFVVVGFDESLLVLLAAILYVGGMFFVTGRGSVPLNNLLRDADVTDSNSNEVWNKYRKSWTRLNTVRCFFGVTSAMALIAFIIITS